MSEVSGCGVSGRLGDALAEAWLRAELCRALRTCRACFRRPGEAF